MPLVELFPGKSLPLNAGDHDGVMNNSKAEGSYVISYNLMPLSVPHGIAPKSHVTFVVPKGGMTIENNGKVELTVTTPGL